MVNQPAHQPKNDKQHAANESHAAIPLGADQAALEAKKKMANLVMIVVIVAFVGAGLMMIPSVRQTVLGGGSAGGGGGAPVAVRPGEPAWEKPRDALPMGQYTLPFFKKPKPFVINDPNGGRRGIQYYLYSPRGAADSGQKYPLVVFLHDEKGLADGAVQLLTKQMQQTYPAYILVPMLMQGKTWGVPAKYQGQEFPPKNTAAITKYWNGAKFPAARQSMGDVLNLVATLLSRIPTIDDGRIYVAGCAEGGIGTYGALANYGEFFAGGIAASGFWSFTDAHKLAQTPLLIIQGGKDVSVPPEHARMMSQVIQQVGGKQIAYQEFPDLARNCADPRYFPFAAWQWLFAQKKPALAPAEPAPAPATP